MEWVDQVVERARDRARFRVAALRATHPGEDQVALGRRLIGSSALRAGLSGAATGTLALIAFPIGLPAGVAVSLYLEAELIFGLLEVYDSDTAGEQGRLKLYALWAGAGFAGAARSAGLRAGARVIGRVLEGSLPVRIIRRLSPALLKAILRRLGLGWLPRAVKLWPIIGAPISFLLDRAALRTLGEATLATLDDDARKRRRQPAEGRPKRYRRVKLAAAPAR
ncbi:MAG TPA: hypothetical protein VFE90_22965 [Myxococcales bacterium]|jgi:hypothetical protein|nr:hypothetical protein [Myxococcales bacterium]